jgi:hypothetical protein
MPLISNPLGAQGTPAKYNNPQTVVPMRSGGAILAGRVVSLTVASGALTATSATTAVDTDLCRGVAISAAVGAGEAVQVAVAGYVASVLAQGTINAGDTVGRSGTTAGAVAAVATPTSGAALGVALTAAASNLVDIWIFG